MQACPRGRGRASAEGEGERLDARVEKPDLEGAIHDRPGLPDELVEALPGHDVMPVDIDASAAALTGPLAVDGDAEPHPLAVRPGAEDLKGRSARTNTKGSTGRMQGLTIVRAPARYASRATAMRLAHAIAQRALLALDADQERDAEARDCRYLRRA